MATGNKVELIPEEPEGNHPGKDATARIAAPYTDGRATFVTLLLAVVLPTAAYMIMAERFGFLGPRLNVDLLLVSIVGILLARSVSLLAAPFMVVGIALVLAIQVGIGVGTVYIDDPALIREYISFVRFWPWRLISFWGMAAAAGLFPFYLLLKRVDVAKASLLPMAALLLLLSGLDIAGRTAVGYSYLGDNIATSSAVRLGKLLRQWAISPGFSARPIDRPMLVREVVALRPLPERVVSVSVEALGLANDPHFNEAVMAPMRGILKDRFTIEIGRHAFEGGTLSGEMRELCNQRTAGTPTLNAARTLSVSCLPELLAKRGYETLGMHGNSGFFYNRSVIYPELGFRKALFYEDLAKGVEHAPKCKTRAFDGICDSAMFAKALAFVGDRPNRYAHVMTLDTHFPLGATALGDERCGRVPGLSDPDLCLYANQMANLLAGLARQIAASPVPPDAIYIFGDHAPPYIVGQQRMFFDRHTVPFITIRRR